MTADELEACEEEPLWSEEGQVMWLLDQRIDQAELLPASTIGKELQLTPPAAALALKRLQSDGKATSRPTSRGEVWGSTEQLRRLDEADQRAEAERRAHEERVIEHNRSFDEVREELDEVFSGRSIEVSSLERTFPGASGRPRRDQLIIHVGDVDDAAWLLGRVRHPARDEGSPTDAEWSDLFDHFDKLLGCLTWAGWTSYEDDEWTDYEHGSGPTVATVLRRTCMAIEVEYRPTIGLLRLRPYEDPGDEWPEMSSMLDEEIFISLGEVAEDQPAKVRAAAGEAGLLDATRLAVDEDARSELSGFMMRQYIEWVYQPAAAYRSLTVEELVTEAFDDKPLLSFIRFTTAMVASDVMPDCVPDAATLGVAAWCWRNNTDVEAWHLANDVLMARVNMAVTAAIEPHICPFEGVDWAAIKAALTDSSWSLPDGRVISELFGEGWPDVQRTVSAELDTWRRIDEEVLGPDATMRLLTVGGSTSYTCHWWGQGRWRAICDNIITDAIDARISLPPPYDKRGSEALLSDLDDPQNLADEVLDWLIDMPEGGTDGPRGLRYHPATRPIRRIIDPMPLDLDADS